MLAAADTQGIQVLWTLCHYGWPADVDVFAPAFVDRFARYCRATATFIRNQTDAVPFYTPINEISFLAWAAGQVGYIYPCARSRGVALKRQLVRATIAGIDAIRDVDPRARFVHVEPLIHAVAPRGRPERAAAAARQRLSQFEAWDMLSGRRFPQLGGDPTYLDIVGVNFYHDNQWETSGSRWRRRLCWEDEPRDDRWRPLHMLLGDVHRRYRRPLVISETSHIGEGRGRWIREIAVEVGIALAQGVPVEGICLYPVIDRPDWEHPNRWHHSGLWDVVADEHRHLLRVLNEPYADDLAVALRMLDGSGTQGRLE